MSLGAVVVGVGGEDYYGTRTSLKFIRLGSSVRTSLEIFGIKERVILEVSLRFLYLPSSLYSLRFRAHLYLWTERVA